MNLRDKTITCRDCGRRFIFTARDQQLYAEQGFINTPTRCPECRATHRASPNGGHKPGENMADVPHDMPSATRQATAALRPTHSKDGTAVCTQDISALRGEVAELSYRCDMLAAERAKLEREKASLLEKVGLLASERDYLKTALAGLSGTVSITEKAASLAPRPWWKRIFG